MPRKKDPYQVDRNFLPNPATALYKVEEGVISKLPWIEELVDTARYLEERIAGDFDKIDSFIAQIHENNFGFVRTGLIAYKLKYFKAYRKIAKTFKRFCEDHLHKSHWMINRLIVAAKVVIDLIAAGFDQLPKNEAQCRSLLAGCEDDLASAWQFVLDAHEGELHKITAKSITRCLKGEQEEPKMQTLVVTAMLYAAIWKAAELKKLKPVEYLEEIFLGRQNGDNFAQKKKQERWEDDLEDLVEEHENSA